MNLLLAISFILFPPEENIKINDAVDETII